MEAISNKRLRLKSDDEVEHDLFNGLPDELIVSHIFSRFTFEEGAQLCILSKRWNKLWAQTIPPKLIFEPKNLCPPRSRIIVRDDKQINRDKPCFKTKQKRLVEGECSQLLLWGVSSNCCSSRGSCLGFTGPRSTDTHIEYYSIETPYDKVRNLSPSLANWITKVLQGYCMPKLDEVTVRFPFNSESTEFIDGWIECALKKGVSCLELDLYHSDRNFRKISYTFPKTEKLLAMFSGFINLSLREVRLKGVCVSSEVIHFMLDKCPIEHLCLWLSHFSDLRIISVDSIRLKRLELKGSDHRSTRLKRSELEVPDFKGGVWISASSLVSLKYAGPKSWLHLEHVPNLSELSVDPEYCHSETLIETDRAHFRCIVTRLKKLELAISAVEKSLVQEFPMELLEATCLEELTVRLDVTRKACVLWPMLVIKSATFLRKLTIKLNELHRRVNISDARVRDFHIHLKVVELYGYRSHPGHMELVKKYLCISAALEQFVVALAPSDEVSRNQAHQELAMLLPFDSKVNITILNIEGAEPGF